MTSTIEPARFAETPPASAGALEVGPHGHGVPAGWFAAPRPAGARTTAREYPETRFRVGPITRDAGMRVPMRVGLWMQGPDGAVSVGSLGVMVDDAIGLEVHNVRPTGWHSVTAELSLDVLVPPPWPGPELVARAGLVHLGAEDGISRAEVLDGSGQVVAVAIGRCRFVPAPGTLPEDEFGPPIMPAEHLSIVDVLGASDGAPSPGPSPEPDQDGAAGALAFVPSAGVAHVVIPASRAFENGGGTVHGGVLAAGSEVAAAMLAEHGTPEQTTSVRLNFLRPVSVEQDVTFTASTYHRGRSVSVYRVISHGPSRKPCTIATVTRTRVSRTAIAS